MWWMPALAGAALYASVKGQKDTNAANAAEAQRNRDFQERMRDTQYQAAVRDLRAAGLNPALAYSQGGAAAPSGSTARFENPAEGFGRGLDYMMAQAQLQLTNAQTAKTAAEARQIGLESAGRVDLLGADIGARTASAGQARAQTAMLERQVQELRETWSARRVAPELANDRQRMSLMLDKLERVYREGTLEERMIAAQLVNRLTSANIRWTESRAELMDKIRDIFAPMLDLSRQGYGRLGAVLDEAKDWFSGTLDRWSKVPTMFEYMARQGIGR